MAPGQLTDWLDRAAIGASIACLIHCLALPLGRAVPALELNRLNTLLGTGTDVLRGFGIGLLALATLGFFVALLSAVQERQRELALLRALGGGPGLLLRLVLAEALLLGLAGGALGLALGRSAALVAARARAAADPRSACPRWGAATWSSC